MDNTENNETNVAKTKSWLRRNGMALAAYAVVIGGSIGVVLAAREYQKREIRENGRMLGEGFVAGVAEATAALTELAESVVEN